jgi:hypothetical protein
LFFSFVRPANQTNQINEINQSLVSPQTKTKVGYEIPLNRHFYRYEPPRQLEVIETDIKRLEDDILKMLKEVTA